ncbi:cyclase family protein [Streptomyces sp. NPDC051452]|uniref:cyclase family protein n=1 Tax=Streptomyces sp. NPDC051452 TaxID=3365654 RepID=UPI00379F9B9A
MEVSGALRVAEHEVNVLRLRMGSQYGTHVDAPYHLDEAWPALDDLPLERFAGPAVVTEVHGVPVRAPITAGLLGNPPRPRPLPPRA